jgi:hypothetical protein
MPGSTGSLPGYSHEIAGTDSFQKDENPSVTHLQIWIRNNQTMSQGKVCRGTIQNLFAFPVEGA